MKKMESISIKSILLINRNYKNVYDSNLKVDYLPIILSVLKKLKPFVMSEKMTKKLWQQDIIIQNQSVREFLIQTVKNPFKRKYDVVIVLCDYNQRKKKFIFMILTFLCRTKIRLAIFSSNLYNILSLSYLIRVIYSIVLHFFKSFVLKVIFAFWVVVNWIFTPRCPKDTLG